MKMMKRWFTSLAYKQTVQRIEWILEYREIAGNSHKTKEILAGELERLRTLIHDSPKREAEYRRFLLEVDAK